MSLLLRPTGLSSPAYKDRLDYVVIDDGREIGRIYDDRHASVELRWFWSIKVYVDPRLGIRTDGRTTTLDSAKEQFRRSWERVRAIPPSANAPSLSNGYESRLRNF